MERNQIKLGIVLSYISLIVGNIVAIVYTPVLIRLLGQSEYGLYNLVSSFVAYLGLLSLGFDNTYLRYYTQYKATRDQKQVASLNGMFFLVFSIIGIIALLAGFTLVTKSNALFGSKLTNYELVTAKKLMLLLVINISIAFPATLFKVFINANERFIFAKMVNMVKTIINPFIMLPLLLMGYKSVAMVIVTLCYSVAIDLVNMWYCFAKLDLRIRFKDFKFSLLKNIGSFAFFIFLGEIVDEINWNVDKYLLGRFSGTVAVAIYGIGAQLSSYFRQFSIYISSVFAPRVNRIVALTNDNNELTNLMIKIGRIQFAVLSLVCVCFIFLGRMFCNLWAGANYDQSYAIALTLMLPSIIPLIQNIGISILTARSKHQFRSILYFFIAIANVGISIPLCIKLNGLGCAIGTAISLFIGNGVIINIYYKKLGINIFRFWKEIISMCKGVAPTIIIGIIMFGMDLPYNWIVFFGGLTVLCTFFFVSMYFLGFNDIEKKMLKNGWKIISHKG